jgi:alpha-glucosidase
MRIAAFCLCILIPLLLPAQKRISLNSPDGNLVFTFYGENNQAAYSVSYKKQLIIDKSFLSLEFKDGSFANNLKAGKPVYHDSTEDYDLITGKTSHVHDAYKEMLIPLQSTDKRVIQLAVRAFNDGIAFQYRFPYQQNKDSFELTDENTTFNLSGNPVVKALLFPNYTSSHEGYYTTVPLNDLKEDTLMDMPALFEFPGHVYMAVTEAALLDYAGMYLSKHKGILISKLSPLPTPLGPVPNSFRGDGSIKVKAALPHVSPWRVMLISDRIGALIESNIITDLNAPCAIKDLSWIKPGKTTFPWWNGNVTPDTLNAPGNNFVTNQYYIDFCARNHIQYHSVVEYGLHQWYTDDGVGFQPGPHSDVTTPVPGLDMKEICDYAHSKGVDVRVWVHFYALYPKLDSAFSIFEQWGLSGMMVDFMDRDDQQMVNMQTEILQKAAAHHLHIQFHGAYKPTGLSRTYPNEFTREGTLNYETNKWNPEGLSPDHDLNIVFTRMLAGSTDYHLGGFRAVTADKFKTQYTRPLMAGTRCHMLGMYVVLENALGMVCDYPAAYEGEPGFEFIQEVPTTWDETKVLNAEVSKYITIARRKNTGWFVGTINNHESRQLTIPLSFLSDGNYTATIFSDADDVTTDPNHLNKETRSVTAKDILTLNIAGGGGAAVYIKKD